uniref:Glucose-6-phosphate 1-dehydrogenase, cytoplasmic isoform n=1 Tax=Arundo donax TaxID=35708 RepID=A0A0A9CXE3_ARUDO
MLMEYNTLMLLPSQERKLLLHTHIGRNILRALQFRSPL